MHHLCVDTRPNHCRHLQAQPMRLWLECGAHQCWCLQTRTGRTPGRGDDHDDGGGGGGDNDDDDKQSMVMVLSEDRRI